MLQIRIDIVDQEHLPGKLSRYDVVILYLHFKLFETTESKVIEFTEKGGSKKRGNRWNGRCNSLRYAEQSSYKVDIG